MIINICIGCHFCSVYSKVLYFQGHGNSYLAFIHQLCSNFTTFTYWVHMFYASFCVHCHELEEIIDTLLLLHKAVFNMHVYDEL